MAPGWNPTYLGLPWSSTGELFPMSTSTSSFPPRRFCLKTIPALIPAGVGPRAFGLGDIELGIKYRFVQETKHRPMIGTFIMFEVPTGSAARGLGVGETWYKVPFGCRKALARGPPTGAAA